MNSQNNYNINEFSLFPLYGWCINYPPRFNSLKNLPKQIDYKVNEIKKINRTDRLNKQKEDNHFPALNLGRYIDLNF